MKAERYFNFQDVTTRSDENDNPVVEGMFIVYDSPYCVYEGATESIARGALSGALNGDVRALYNHNTDLVLGRTSAGTLRLQDTDAGVWGSITINKNDSEAMNAYARIQRGDITGASFGFDIVDESTSIGDNGEVHWTINKIDPLYEISPCVFPAYQATHITARGEELETIRKRRIQAWQERATKLLRGEKNGTESTDDPQED